MKTSAFARRTICIVAAAILGGCAPFLTPRSLSPLSPASGAAHDARSTEWLYVSADPFGIGTVYVFAFPNLNKIKAIENLEYAYGPCADSSGHVWIPAISHRRAVVMQFLAGETKSIAQLDLPRGSGIGECAVDSVTGNLAVVASNSVNIFAKTEAKWTNYALGRTYVMACAYDGQGNLFVDGEEPISTSRVAFVLYELAKGSSSFSTITLDKRVGLAGGLEWDGDYLAVATGGDGVKPVIYRFSVSGSKGTVVQSVHPNGLNFQAWFAIVGGQMIGTSGLYAPKIRLWPYPAGGEWIWEMPNLETQGMVIATSRR